MRSDRDRLFDIVEAIEKIEERASRDIDDFAEDEMQQVWVIHHLKNIGQAASGLSEELRSQHPEVPWNEMIGMRRVLRPFGIGARLTLGFGILVGLIGARELRRRDPARRSGARHRQRRLRPRGALVITGHHLLQLALQPLHLGFRGAGCLWASATGWGGRSKRG